MVKLVFMRNACNYLALICVAVGLLTGCKGKTAVESGGKPDPQVVEAAQKLPEGQAVLTALDQKDYEGAVSGLVKMQPTAESGELGSAFLALKLHVRTQLLELSEKDPKAAEALSALRSLTQGR